MSQTRRLAAILAADVAGYSRLMGLTRKARSNVSTQRRAPVAPLPVSAYYTSDIKGMRCRARLLTIRS